MEDMREAGHDGTPEGTHAEGEKRAATATVPEAKKAEAEAKTGAGAGSDEKKKPTAANAGSGTDDKKTPGDSPPGQADDTSQKQKLDSEAVSLAVDIGWTMAVLFGLLEHMSINGRQPVDDRLPTEHELLPYERRELEEHRLNMLLARLRTLFPASLNPEGELPKVHLATGGAEAGAAIQASGSDRATEAPADGANAVAPAPPGREALAPPGKDNPAPAKENDPASVGKADPSSAEEADRKTLNDANLEILVWLACAGREYSTAYQLGRSLRDTAAPPPREYDAKRNAGKQEIDTRASQLQASSEWTAIQAKKILPPEEWPQAAEERAQREFEARDALLKQLSRARVSKIQEWLSTLGPYLPTDSAAIVSASIGRWSDLITTIFVHGPKGKPWVMGPPGKLRAFSGQSELQVAGELTQSLLPQGDAWINMLVGAESSQGLLTPEGLVAAGEAALGRTARIVKRIAVHYWFVLLILAVALAAALYFASRDLSGAGKIWTQIAAVAGALGITARGISNTMTRLSEDAEKPIFGAEKIDAMAWAVTTIPDQLKLSMRGVRALRRSGIPPSGPMGRLQYRPVVYEKGRSSLKVNDLTSAEE
jgi:hypothetical protein